jgi:hypothetical protein
MLARTAVKHKIKANKDKITANYNGMKDANNEVAAAIYEIKTIMDKTRADFEKKLYSRPEVFGLRCEFLDEFYEALNSLLGLPQYTNNAVYGGE